MTDKNNTTEKLNFEDTLKLNQTNNFNIKTKDILIYNLDDLLKNKIDNINIYLYTNLIVNNLVEESSLNKYIREYKNKENDFLTFKGIYKTEEKEIDYSKYIIILYKTAFLILRKKKKSFYLEAYYNFNKSTDTQKSISHLMLDIPININNDLIYILNSDLEEINNIDINLNYEKNKSLINILNKNINYLYYKNFESEYKDTYVCYRKNIFDKIELFYKDKEETKCLNKRFYETGKEISLTVDKRKNQELFNEVLNYKINIIDIDIIINKQKVLLKNILNIIKLLTDKTEEIFINTLFIEEYYKTLTNTVTNVNKEVSSKKPLHPINVIVKNLTHKTLLDFYNLSVDRTNIKNTLSLQLIYDELFASQNNNFYIEFLFDYIDIDRMEKAVKKVGKENYKINTINSLFSKEKSFIVKLEKMRHGFLAHNDITNKEDITLLETQTRLIDYSKTFFKIIEDLNLFMTGNNLQLFSKEYKEELLKDINILNNNLIR